MKPNRFNFRVWDKENKKMVYPDGNGYFQLENDTVITGNGDLFDLENPEIVENCILMQSTGLVDKNGKEVFEGDIIKYKYRFDWNDYKTSVVEYDTKIYMGFLPFVVFDYNESEWVQLKTVEVIGNTYENPELLEEFKENESK